MHPLTRRASGMHRPRPRRPRKPAGPAREAGPARTGPVRQPGSDQPGPDCPGRTARVGVRRGSDPDQKNENSRSGSGRFGSAGPMNLALFCGTSSSGVPSTIGTAMPLRPRSTVTVAPVPASSL